MMLIIFINCILLLNHLYISSRWWMLVGCEFLVKSV